MDQDRELILRAQKGDMAAFNTLVRLHDRPVLALAARYVDNAEDAKDIYQEVMIRVYKGLNRFRLDSEFATWLHRITVNVCLSHRRSSRKEMHVPVHDTGEEGSHTLELQSHEAGPDAAAADADTADHVRRALGALSPRQHMVFTLRHYEGRTLKEIANTLQCSEGAVKRYLHTATRRMRTQLEGLF